MTLREDEAQWLEMAARHGAADTIVAGAAAHLEELAAKLRVAIAAVKRGEKGVVEHAR